MKKIAFVFIFLITLDSYSQSLTRKRVECNVLVDVDYKGTIDLYDKKGKVIRKLQNNIAKQDFIVLTIIGRKDSMFRAIATYQVSGDSLEGWIKKNNYNIGVYARNYASELNLYQMPDKKSNVKSVVRKYTPELYHVVNYEGDWLYVYIVIENKKYEGWLEPEMQCANPYTTCN